MQGGCGRPGKGRSRRVWVGALVLGAMAGCAQVKAFLIPPRQPDPNVSARRSAVVFADAVLLSAQVVGVQAEAKAVAWRAGRIVAMGSHESLMPLVGPNTRVQRYPAAVVAPGFVDAHVHLEGAAMLGDAADLRGATDGPEVSRRLARAAVTLPNRPRAWLWGFGLSGALAQRMTGADAEAWAGGRPVWLSTHDGHGALVGAGLASLLPAPVAERILAADGRIGEALAAEAWRSLPPPSVARLKPLLAAVLEGLARDGVTEVHAMAASRTLYEALVMLERERRLPVRCRLFLDGLSEPGQDWLKEPRIEAPSTPAARGSRSRWQETRLVQVVGVKFWLDGALGARTAALTEPYADAASQRGSLRASDAEVRQWIVAADRAGLQVALHALGDAAVAQVVRVLTGLPRPTDAPPVRIEHAQVVSPASLSELGRLPVLCSVQPIHAADDANFAFDRLGRERMTWAYRAASLSTVCPLLAGSDLPVSAPDPMAMVRHLSGKGSAVGRVGSEVLEPELAFAAVWPGGTARAGQSLNVGDWADLVVWSADPQQVDDARPVAVLVGGVVIWAASDGAPSVLRGPGLSMQ